MEEELDISKETYEKVRKIYQDFINDNDDADWTLRDYFIEECIENGLIESPKDFVNYENTLPEDYLKERLYDVPEESLKRILAQKSIERRRKKKIKIISSLTEEESFVFLLLEAKRGNELAEKYGMKTYDIEEK